MRDREAHSTKTVPWLPAHVGRLIRARPGSMITRLPLKIASSSEDNVSAICVASSRVRIAVGYWITTIPKWLPKGNLSRFPKSLSPVNANGLPFLRRRVNPRIGGTAQIEFLDMVGGMTSLSQERGQQKRQVFVNEESRHQDEARTVSSSSLWAA